MREEQFGGDTVYRVYERERLRQMARKLGLRLLKCGKKAGKAAQGYSGTKPGPVLIMGARRRAVSE